LTTSPLRPDILPEQRIQLTPEEQQSGQLSDAHRRLASVILSCRGYVVLKDALSQDFVETLRAEMMDIYADCRATMDPGETGTDYHSIQKVRKSERKQAAFWYRKSRYRIFPRLAAPMNDPRLLANSFVTPILEDMLGKDFYCKYVSSDTCLNGAILQSPHSDIDNNDVMVDNRWKARGYIVNVPIMDCGLHNGPIEVWPGGSHMWTSDLMNRFGLAPNIQDGRNPPVEEVAEFFPSIKLAIKPGEILIRDLSMWHRGTPNPTDEPRTMLTMAFFRGGYGYAYGDLDYSIDETLFKAMDPRVQPLFAYHYSLASRLGRTKKQLRKRVGRVVKKMLGRPVEPAH